MTALSARLYLRRSLFRGKFFSKAILVAAIMSLAFMVIALGAAAKHSQFESHAHHSFYLGKAVKMANDCSGGNADAACIPSADLVILPAIPLFSSFVQAPYHLPVLAVRTVPLLV